MIKHIQQYLTHTHPNLIIRQPTGTTHTLFIDAPTPNGHAQNPIVANITERETQIIICLLGKTPKIIKTNLANPNLLQQIDTLLQQAEEELQMVCQ